MGSTKAVATTAIKARLTAAARAADGLTAFRAATRIDLFGFPAQRRVEEVSIARYDTRLMCCKWKVLLTKSPTQGLRCWSKNGLSLSWFISTYFAGFNSCSECGC